MAERAFAALRNRLGERPLVDPLRHHVISLVLFNRAGDGLDEAILAWFPTTRATSQQYKALVRTLRSVAAEGTS